MATAMEEIQAAGALVNNPIPHAIVCLQDGTETTEKDDGVSRQGEPHARRQALLRRLRPDHGGAWDEKGKRKTGQAFVLKEKAKPLYPGDPLERAPYLDQPGMGFREVLARNIKTRAERLDRMVPQLHAELAARAASGAQLSKAEVKAKAEAEAKMKADEKK